MRKISTGLFISLATFLVLFLICEVFARIFLPAQQTVQVSHKGLTFVTEKDGKNDSLLDWSGNFGIRVHPNISVLIKNRTLSNRDVTIETNSFGLRYPEIGPRVPGEFRVLVLGDSITFGDYVNANETYTAIMEELLKSENRPIKVINAGLPGANAYEEYYYYLELKDAVKPDLVLLALYLNDSTYSEKFYTESLTRPWSNSRFLSWLTYRIQLANKIMHRETSDQIQESWREDFRNGRDLRPGNLKTDPNAVDYEIYSASGDFGLGWNPKAWSELSGIVKELSAAVLKEGSQFGAFLLPVHFQVMGDVNNHIPQQEFANMCARLGLKCFDPLPELKMAYAESRDQQMYYDQCHLTPKGDADLAGILVKWLKQAKYWN